VRSLRCAPPRATRVVLVSSQRHSGALDGLHPALSVLPPLRLATRRKKELEHWYSLCPGEPVRLFIFEDEPKADKDEKAKQRRTKLEKWQARGGIMLMGCVPSRAHIAHTSLSNSGA
jgi:hypothetical protein